MRIGTRASIELIKDNITRPSNELGELYRQLTSGKRLQRPSDDPLATVRVVRAQADLSELSSRKYVLQTGKQLIASTDSALGDISDSLSRANDLTLDGASATLEEDQRKAIADEIRGLSKAIVASGNTSVHGQYIFSGSKIDTAPLEMAEGANLPVLYHGNHQQLVYSITSTETVPAGITGTKVFNYADENGERANSEVDTDVFSLLEEVATAVESGDVDRISELQGEVQSCHSYVVALRGEAGVIEQRYDNATAAAEESELRVEELLSTDRDIDYASAMTDLSQQQIVYQAALSLTTRLLDMPNLFDR